MTLTDEQYKQLADALTGTRNNVYTLAKRMFGVDWDDEAFAALEAKTGVFRCIECSEWKDRDEKDPDVTEMCTPCVCEMNGEEPDE